MSNAVRPDLINADGVEITDYLQSLGWTSIKTQIEADAMYVSAEGAGDLDVALDAFVPTTTRGNYLAPLSANLASHVSHIKDYYTAQRDGSQAAKTGAIRLSEAEHVIGDLALVLREVYSRLNLE